MESLIRKLSLILASDSELWKDLLMSGTRTLDPGKSPKWDFTPETSAERGEACVSKRVSGRLL